MIAVVRARTEGAKTQTKQLIHHRLQAGVKNKHDVCDALSHSAVGVGCQRRVKYNISRVSNICLHSVAAFSLCAVPNYVL